MLPKASLTTLKNGCRIVSVPIRTDETVTFVVAFRAGTRGEKRSQRGISHFLEHLVFKGSEKFPTSKAFNDACASMGATYNAATNMEFTYFVIQAPKTRGLDVLESLADIVQRPLIPEEEFGHERRVVFDEALRAKVESGYRLSVLFEDVMYQHQPLGWDINGTISTLKSVTRRQALNYHRKWYVARRACVVMIGGGNMTKLKKRAETLFREMPKGDSFDWPPFRRKARGAVAKHVRREEDMTSMTFGVPGVGKDSRDLEATLLLQEAFGGDTSSRLYDRIREKEGLVYEIMAEAQSYEEAGHFSVTTQAANADAQAVLEHLIEEFERLASDPLNAEELRRAKAIMSMHVASAGGDHESLARFYFMHLFANGKLTQLSEMRRRMARVDLGTIQSLASRLVGSRERVLVSLGPKPLRFPTKR